MAMIYDPLVHYQKNVHRMKNVNPDYYRQIELLADESEGVLGNISSSTAVSIKVFHNKKTCQRAPVACSLITRGRGRTPARGYLLEGANEGNKSQLKEEVPPLGGLQLVVSHVGHLEVVLTLVGGLHMGGLLVKGLEVLALLMGGLDVRGLLLGVKQVVLHQGGLHLMILHLKFQLTQV
ncbi:hypothetical protein ACSBR1_035020 [Camellia fascicularis]